MNFKQLIFIFFALIFVASYKLEKYYAQTHKINYLNYRAIDLSHHVITDKNLIPIQNVLMLGSSSLAGSNIPHNSTLSDYLNRLSQKSYHYNLGMLEGTLIDSFVFFKLAEKERRPNLIILGLSPDMFVRNTDSIPLATNYEFVKNDFSVSFQKEAEARFQNKLYFRFVLNQIGERTIPFGFILKMKEKMNLIQQLIFNPSYDFHVKENELKNINFVDEKGEWLEVLETLINYAQKRNVKIVTYIEPHLFLDKTFKTEELSAYKNKLEEFLKRKNVQVVDYSNTIPNSPEYFIDYVHLTPKGNQLLAERIFQDIKYDQEAK